MLERALGNESAARLNYSRMACQVVNLMRVTSAAVELWQGLLDGTTRDAVCGRRCPRCSEELERRGKYTFCGFNRFHAGRCWCATCCGTWEGGGGQGFARSGSVDPPLTPSAFVVPKESGTPRLIVDARGLNARLLPPVIDPIPLPPRTGGGEV